MAVTVAVAAVLFLAGGGLRNGAGLVGRAAQMLAIAVNVAVLVLGVSALARFSGAEAVVVSACVVALAVACLAGLAADLRAAVLGRPAYASTYPP